MPQAFAKANPLQPEYSVYIYHHPENQHEGQNDWEMRTVTRDLDKALNEARSLYRSQSFRKVEVKQRIVDPKTENPKDFTLKIFSEDRTDPALSTWVVAFGLVLSLAALMFGVLNEFRF